LVTTDGTTTASVRLEKDLSALEDVVVIGYQSVKRKNLLASVSSVGARDLKDIPINSAAEVLNGRLAGVTATTAEGSPDAQIRIRVRGGMSITGDNSPLFIVDGVQAENALSTISPQDIQSIDVLKDAAATAIYGLGGDNIIIRYLRFRMGDKYQKGVMVDGNGGDDAFGGTRKINIIIDHCSLSWSTDEVFSVYGGDSTTLQWNLIAEPLNYSYHFETGTITICMQERAVPIILSIIITNRGRIQKVL
jgi:TonB-dependent SusC/RagA subfamily outer membrane receptor